MSTQATPAPRRPTLTLGPKPVTSAWLYDHAAELRADGSADLWALAVEVEERAYALEQHENNNAGAGL
jgi:hypothetical protein